MDEPRVSRRRFLASSALALSAGVAGCSLGAPAIEDGESDNRSGFPDEFERPPDLEELPSESGLTDVYRELVDSVAAVRIENEQGTGGGTAWVWEDDYVVTNEHVARLTDDPFLWFHGEGWSEGSVVGMDRYSDLAVIEVSDKPSAAKPLPLVDSPKPVGTPVAVIGNPFNLTSSFSTGIISGRNRTIDLPNRAFSIANAIQTDAALNPGNSGGPLVTYDGEVAGVVSAGQGENVGFAISAAMTRRVVPALIEDGDYDHTYMGVLLRDVTPNIIDANDLGGVTWGVYIDRVLDDGPSHGVLEGSTSTTVVRGRETPVGGDVIVRMGDQAILNREHLSSFLAIETEPGDTISVELIRDGERETVDLTLGQRPESPQA